MGVAKIEKRLLEGSTFFLRFCAAAVALAGIQMALIDLQNPKDSLEWDFSYHKMFLVFFLIMDLELFHGVVWQFDSLLVAWLLVYSITIPIGTLMLAAHKDFPWALGFSKAVANYLTNKFTLEPDLAPVIGLLNAFFKYLIVFVFVACKTVFSDMDKNVLPRHWAETQQKQSSISKENINFIVDRVLQNKTIQAALNKMAAEKPLLPGEKMDVILPVVVPRKMNQTDNKGDN